MPSFVTLKRLRHFFWLTWDTITVLRKGMTRSHLHFTRFSLVVWLGSVFQVRGSKSFIQSIKGRKVRSSQILDILMKGRVVRTSCALKVSIFYLPLSPDHQIFKNGQKTVYSQNSGFQIFSPFALQSLRFYVMSIMCWLLVLSSPRPHKHIHSTTMKNAIWQHITGKALTHT